MREAYEAQHELDEPSTQTSLADRRALAAALETLMGTPLDKSLDGTSEGLPPPGNAQILRRRFLYRWT
ncbi:MAG: hypothetical protein Ct9H300mP12_12110 [Acidimicrobiales bacterium]|nr:MAG: hypothetical protein Ct9H300mP12_12110 [Acidimicrobiales bacterium]